MTRILPLLALASTLAVSTACFEIDRHVTLNKDGSAKVVDGFAITDSLLSIFRQMNEIDPSENIAEDAPEMPSKESFGALESKGVKVTRFDSSFTLDKFFYSIELQLDSFASVAHTAPVMPIEGDDKADPLPMSLVKTGKKAYTLTILADPPPTKPGGNDDQQNIPGRGEEVPESASEGKELTLAEQQKMMELSLSMLDTAKDLRFTQSITVPGEITEFGPKHGTQKGNTVTWVQDETFIQKAMAEGVEDDGRRWVSFTAKGLPDSALHGE